MGVSRCRPSRTTEEPLETVPRSGCRASPWPNSKRQSISEKTHCRLPLPVRAGSDRDELLNSNGFVDRAYLVFFVAVTLTATHQLKTDRLRASIPPCVCFAGPGPADAEPVTTKFSTRVRARGAFTPSRLRHCTAFRAWRSRESGGAYLSARPRRRPGSHSPAGSLETQTPLRAATAESVSDFSLQQPVCQSSATGRNRGARIVNPLADHALLAWRREGSPTGSRPRRESVTSSEVTLPRCLSASAPRLPRAWRV